MHGPTYMGNPLACAVALANLDLLADRRLARPGRPASTPGSSAGLAECRDLPGVADVRTLGAVGVVELDHPVDVVKATDAALAHGVWLRPFRDLVYTMPPYVSTDEDDRRHLHGAARGGRGGRDERHWDGATGSPSGPLPARRPDCSGRCAPAARATTSSTWPATTTSASPGTPR